MEVKLIELGDYGNREIPVSEKEFVIGREITCHLRLNHGKVALRHCRLFWRGLHLMVEDMNSASGTFLNDQRLDNEPAELQDGDELKVGPVPFLVIITPAANESPPAPIRPGATARGAATEGEADAPASPGTFATARQLLDRVAGPDAAALGLPAGFFGDAFQRKLRVSQERGVILAEVVDRAIIDDGDIRQIGAELGELISAGQSRIALNLGNVEHLSSRAVGTVLKVHRRCRDQGGMLKICGVRPQVAEIFALTNLARHIEIFPDELPALESYWPGRPSAPKPEPTAKLPSAATPAAPAQKASARVRLIVETGKAKGQAIRIGISRFLIGRDPRCHLRPNSETISRLHAVIEQREGRVFVRDCGTVNGTLLGDRTLRQEEAEAHDGDSLGVGVLRFRFSITPRAEGPAPPQGSPTIEDQMTAWLLGQDKTDPNADTAQIPTFDPNAPDQR